MNYGNHGQVVLYGANEIMPRGIMTIWKLSLLLWHPVDTLQQSLSIIYPVDYFT